MNDNSKFDLINNLFAIWDPIGMRRFGLSWPFDEYKSYAKEVLLIPNVEITKYLVEIYRDMVNDPDEFTLRNIGALAEIIEMIKKSQD